MSRDPISIGHEDWMRCALAEALRSVGPSSPNPAVGAIVVRDGVEVGRGHTSPPGGPHAEVNALRAAGEAARGATMYVTLEPCCHHGRTPPCVNAIAAAGISRVFLGHKDPNPVVDGRGIRNLREFGIEVVDGLCGLEIAEFYAGYDSWVLKGRPWVTVKLAQSLDGYIAGAQRQRTQISGPTTQKWVHALRARSTAILVGGGTAVFDDPQLSVRDVPGNNPRRVVLAGERLLPSELQLFAQGGTPTLVFSRVPQPQLPPWVEVRMLEAQGFALNWEFILRSLAADGVHHLLVEAGAQLAELVLQEGRWDAFNVLTAPVLLGEGLPWSRNLAPEWCSSLHLSRFEPVGEDVLAVFLPFPANLSS